MELVFPQEDLDEAVDEADQAAAQIYEDFAALRFLHESPSCKAKSQPFIISNIESLGARTLLGAPGLTTRSKDATRCSWHRF